MQTVKGGGHVPRDNLQEVAGHGDDLQVVRAIEHMIRKPRVSQLVVMEIHRPVSHGQGTLPNVNGHNSRNEGEICRNTRILTSVLVYGQRYMGRSL